MLAHFSDANLYQTWSYGAVRWGAGNLSHMVLKREGEVVALAQLRIVQPTSLKAGMAYLRWGPMVHRAASAIDSEVFFRIAGALHTEYVQKRKLLLKVLPNAFTGTSRASLFGFAFSGFTQEPPTSSNIYRTLLLDLQPEVDELRRSLDKKWRNQLNHAERNGLTIVSGIGIDEYRVFCKIYREMRSRKTFETTVDVEEFARLQQDLDPKFRMRVLICEKDGAPVSGIVASTIGDSAIYILGATSDAGLNAKGSYLLQWTLIQWLKQNGFRWYDLGGIDPGGNPGVYHFKSGLGGKDVVQLSPFVACENVLSSALVKAGLAMQRVLRGRGAALQHA